MILLFGDSWARHSAVHVNDPNLQTSAMFVNGVLTAADTTSNYGYRHWELENIFVKFNTDDWFAYYFKQQRVITLSQPANCLDAIKEEIKNCVKGCSNINERLDVLVYQTDPLRNFAFREDYTQKNIVWPKFINWCSANNFDYKNQLLDQLLTQLMYNFYNELMYIQDYIKQHTTLDVAIYLIGGVNKVQSMAEHMSINVLLPSISEFFGLEEDTLIENELALSSLVNWWADELTGSQRNCLLQQWECYTTATAKKIKFWTETPEYFAGRHLTSAALTKIADYIESRLN
jgi:hypothetical protein